MNYKIFDNVLLKEQFKVIRDSILNNHFFEWYYQPGIASDDEPEHLESYFSATLRDCYQVIKVLPPLDEVQIDQEKTTLVIVRPGGQANQLPISEDWQAWWEQQQYKNRHKTR